MAEKPKFWVSRELVLDLDNVDQVMESRIIQLVPQLSVSRNLRTQNIFRIFNRIFKAVSERELPHLRRIECGYDYLSYYDMTFIDPALLSLTIVGLEEVDLTGCVLSTEQLTAVLLRVIETKDLKLKSPIFQQTATYSHFGREGFTC